jgi:ribosome-associated toxin RatA of RatAB toxin-antitoxin module
MIEGESTADINAGIDQVWALVADVERAPQWQGGMKSVVGLERDPDERVLLCDIEVDAKARTLHSRIRFTYDGPTRLSWEQERGELKSIQGFWKLEDLGDARTRATYHVEVDLGRLGFFIRGPIVGVLRAELANARAGELKRAVEQGG